MSIQEIIEKVEKNDKSLNQINLSSADKIEDGELNKLVEVLKKNTCVQILDFSRILLNDEWTIWAIKVLSANKTITKVIFGNLKNYDMFLKELENVSRFTFDLVVNAYQSRQPISMLIQRNKKLEALAASKATNIDLGFDSHVITTAMIDVIIKNLEKISILNLINCIFRCELKTLIEALSKNQTVGEINLSGIKSINVLECVTTLSLNTTLKKVAFDTMALNAEKLDKLEDLTAPTFKIDFISLPSSSHYGFSSSPEKEDISRRIGAIYARNIELKTLIYSEKKSVGLNLSNCAITLAVIDKIVKNLEKISVLNLSSCTLRCELKTLLDALNNSQAVEEINFSGIKSIDVLECIAALSLNTSLKKVIFDKEAINAKQLDKLEELAPSMFSIDFSPRQKSYGLSKSKSESEDERKFFEKVDAVSLRNQSLKSLRGAEERSVDLKISNCTITNRVLDNIIENRTSIKSISLISCVFKEDVLKKLKYDISLCFETKSYDSGNSFFRRNQTLRELKTYEDADKVLSFENTFITEEALNIVIENLHKIKVLKFRGCEFENGLLKELMRELKNNKNIREVSISNTEIPADVVDDFLSLSCKLVFTSSCFDESTEKKVVDFLRLQTDLSRFDFRNYEIKGFSEKRGQGPEEIFFHNRAIDEVDLFLLSRMVFGKGVEVKKLKFDECSFENRLLKELIEELKNNENIQEVSILNTHIPLDVVDDVLSLPCKLAFTKDYFDKTGRDKVVAFLKQQTGLSRFSFGNDKIKNFLNNKEVNPQEINFSQLAINSYPSVIDEIDVLLLSERLKSNLNLKKMDFSSCQLNLAALEIIVDIVKSCVHLESLDLGGNRFGNRSLLLLAEIIRNGSLTSLSIDSNEISNIADLEDALADNQKLEMIDLSRNGFTNIEFIKFANMLEKNKTLATIKLGYVNLPSNASDEEKVGLGDALSKIILRKETQQVSFAGSMDDFFRRFVNIFLKFYKKNLLKKIELEEPGTPTSGANSNSKEESINKRDKFCVDLSKSSLGVNHIRVIIACLENNPQINDVNLSNNDLDDTAAELLFNAINEKNLVISRLNLSGNKIKDHGVAVIVNVLKRNRTLIRLYLGENLFSKSALLNLADLGENKTLMKLYLENSDFDHPSIIEFLQRLFGKNKSEKRNKNKSIIGLSFGDVFGPYFPAMSEADRKINSTYFKPVTYSKIDVALADNISAASNLYDVLLSGDLKKFKVCFKNVSPYYSKDAKENTLLHIAVEKECKEIIEFLWDEGVRDIPNKEGKTALDLAREKNNNELISLLSQTRQLSVVNTSVAETPKSNNSLKRKNTSVATDGSVLKKMKVAEDEDNNVEQEEVQEESFSAAPSSLHDAVERGNYRDVKLCLRSGECDVNAKNTKGQIALWIALSQRNADMVHRLLAEPALAEGVLRDARDFFREERKTDNYLNELLLLVEQRISNEQPVEPGLQWVKSLNVVYGGRGNKSIVIEGDKQLAWLTLQNKFTQQRLSQPLESKEGETEKDVNGNPVTANLTFVVSKGRHYQHQHNERTTITIPLDFTLEFHITHGNENYTDRLKKRMRVADDNHMDIDSQHSMFANTYHHGEQALLEYLEQQDTVNKIVAQLLKNPGMRGAKVYGVVLDIATPRYPCSNCQIAISGEQRSDSEFLKKLKSGLQRAGMQIPKFSDLRMITRVGSYQAFEISAVTAEEHQKMLVDMRTCGNKIILAKDLAAVQSDHTQFTSRA